MVKHFHCPVNGWDCPYYTDIPNPVCVLWKILFMIAMISQVCGMKMTIMLIMIWSD